MSSQVAAQAQTGTPPKGSRRVLITVLLLILLAATAAFGVTVIMAGGIQGVTDLLFGTTSVASTPTGGKAATGGKTAPGGTSTASTSSTAQPVATATAGSATASGVVEPANTQNLPASTPAAFQTRMFYEQVGSQAMITKLVGGGITAITFGKPSVGSTSAKIPTTASLRSGGTYGKSMSLVKSGGAWYFTSIGVRQTSANIPVDSSVVSVLTKTQSTSDAQQAVSDLLSGKIKSLKVTGVTKGVGTASVNCAVTGTGPFAGRKCRFTCIKKSDGATDYWFISRFAWN